jgi:hypothetical protein
MLSGEDMVLPDFSIGMATVHNQYGYGMATVSFHFALLATGYGSTKMTHLSGARMRLRMRAMQREQG